ncbi:DUF648 domain-containing protein [Chlamydia sp. 17-3921]|uniref:DUF648 domain-containing protein n=1 Tax=Chlamydia sp. 17-3921 TaxID=2675798 RepID=UPI001917A8DA|nr:DUF648 domain-containing protein [Chlamydia sp. 17-3921]
MSSFFTPITFSKSFISFSSLQGKQFGILEKLSCKVDSYFDLYGKNIRVVKESVSGGVFCLERFNTISFREKTLKILSYMLLIPVIIMLLVKFILRIILYFKYRPWMYLNDEAFYDLLMFRNDEYHLAPLHPKVLRYIWSQHAALRSGLSKKELERRGIYFISDISAIVFCLKKFPDLVFSSFPNKTEDKDGQIQNSAQRNIEAIRILETAKIFDNHIIRCQALPWTEKETSSLYALIVQGTFKW